MDKLSPASGVQSIASIAPDDVVYLSCLIDVKGCVTWAKEGAHYRFRLMVFSVELWIPEWCRETTGCGSVGARKPTGFGKNPVWFWMLQSGAQMTELCKLILPHLKKKDEHVQVLLRETMHNNAEIAEEIRELNA